jgi:hypothetical protein
MTAHGACSTACKGVNPGGGKGGKSGKGGGKVKGKKGKKNR